MIKELLTIGVCFVSSLSMAKSLDESKIHGNCNHQSTLNGTCSPSGWLFGFLACK